MSIIKIKKLQENKVSGNENDEEDNEQLFNPHIHRIGYSDNWECDRCSYSGDIHFMK
jgi:hypothetical protein